MNTEVGVDRIVVRLSYSLLISLYDEGHVVFGHVWVSIPRYLDNDVDSDTPLGIALGQLLLQGGFVEGESDFLWRDALNHGDEKPTLDYVEKEPDEIYEFFKCDLDGEGRWTIDNTPIAGWCDPEDGEEDNEVTT